MNNKYSETLLKDKLKHLDAWKDENDWFQSNLSHCEENDIILAISEAHDDPC